MVELCDLVNAAGVRLGRTAARGTRPVPGEYFPVIHLWITDRAGSLLIQRRADHLASAAGMWATTGGYVQAGEMGRDAVVREAKEELGLEIDPASLEPLGEFVFEHRRQEVWLLRAGRETLGNVVIGEEVSDWRWETVDSVVAMLDRGEFFAYRYFHHLIVPLGSSDTPSDAGAGGHP